MKTFKIVDCYDRRRVFRTFSVWTDQAAKDLARDFFWLTKCMDIELYEVSVRKLIRNVTFKTQSMFDWLNSERSRKYGS